MCSFYCADCLFLSNWYCVHVCLLLVRIKINQLINQCVFYQKLVCILDSHEIRFRHESPLVGVLSILLF